ncbi:MAG: DNA-directed RNA polymerase subunit beta' [bacterium]
MSSKFKHIKIRLASPEEILSWSRGEVKKHETINYRTLKPEPDGLFCEKIFGPMKDYQCACGKAKRNSDRGQKCEKCGVEITESKVRRERMGHIQLASPVVHVWYLKNSPSRIAVLLDLKAKDLDEVVYLASYIVIDPGKPGETHLVKKQILSEQEYNLCQQKYGNSFLALTGAEAVKKLLQEVDLEKERTHLRKRLNTSSKQKRDKIIKRLEVVESLYNSDNKPEWMVLETLPVIPPDLRPMVQLDGGRFATTDLNDLYRRILNRNNRLKRQFDQHAPHLITKNEKRMLQEAVDSLIDNSKRGKKAATEKNRSLKSLSDMLRGKQGRFRQNLLGKRVDYSGRSVIVVGPDLKMYECGIPRAMAVILFKPFIIRQLIEIDKMSISSAKSAIDNLTSRVWEILEVVAKEHPVLLNRAPTLHRLGIQAFEPKLIDGKAIRLHPLVTTAFNADFDGDQMAVHLPLSPEAQAEARLLMLASNNILNPKDGKPVVTPSQDMVLGNYYLTMEKIGLPNEGHFYSSYEEAYLAYKNHEIELHTRIFLEARTISETKFTDVQLDKFILTTLGKMIFNSVLPVELPYLNEPTKQNIIVTNDTNFLDKTKSEFYDDYKAMLARPAANPFSKKFLSLIISEIFKKFQISETSKILDHLKDLGFKYSTLSGITISAKDVIVLEEKQTLIKQSEAKIDKINVLFENGLLTTAERKNLITDEWTDTRSEIQDKLWKELIKHKENHIFMMADSGARGSTSNFSQLAGMRGLMNNTSGQVMEIPVKANFLEGLTVSEFFISTHGARKGSTDTALKTAESGYLTRRLVDVSQDVIIDQVDCGTEKSFLMQDISSADGVVVELFDRIVGRFAGKDVVSKDGEVIVARNEYITNELAADIISNGITSVYIRSNLTCDSRYGVCMKCYGRNLATNNIVEVGEAVGTIAAQSIGEPGTQLTMRTFHTGGVASTADITQGLPRIQELFEARNPKGKAVISEINGTIKSIDRQKNGIRVIVKNNLSIGGEEYEYVLDQTAELTISKGDQVYQGQRLMKGSIAPRELLRVTDAETTQKYIIEEVQKVYCAQGVEISDKHIEIIVRQMMKKITIVTQGDTMLLPGSELSIHEFKESNKNIFMDVMNNNAKEFAVGRPVLLGITRAALKSESFLSACSFQETTRVLTDAAIRGKIDPLYGLKENVIIGGLIPAGTGILEEDTFECEKDEIDDDFNNEYDVTFAENLIDSDYQLYSQDDII